MDGGAWQAAVHGVTKSQTWLNDFTFAFHFHALEKEMATHSSVLAWRIPGTVEPGGLPSKGSHRVGHDWSDLAAAAHSWLESKMMQLLGQQSSTASGLPRWLSGKESASQCSRCGFYPWVEKIPWRGKWQPTLVLLPGKSHGQSNLVGYSPWGHNEVLIHVIAWMNFENIMLKEISHKGPHIVWFHLYGTLKESKFIEIENGLVVS